MIPSLSELEFAGLVEPGDAALARTLLRLAHVDDGEAAGLAIALASQQVRTGHVCVALDVAPTMIELAGEGRLEGEANAWTWPAPDVWRGALESSGLVEAGEALAPDRSPELPLVLGRAGRLYLSRYYEHERRLAASLLERAAAAEDVDEAALEEGLDRIFGSVRPDDPDMQRRAGEVAIRRRLCVVTGGPGTGKTSTVARVLVLAVEQALARGLAVPRMLLLAPTGKAAAALTSSLERAMGGIDCDDRVRASIPSETVTVHRALRPSGGVGRRFLHDRDAPLDVDLVVLDEASMVDLSLMRRLVEAVPAEARLLMMGDADQLASVEAGAVLGEVCGAGLPADATGPVSASIVRLTKSHRFSDESGVGRLARAVNAGSVEAAFEILLDASAPDVAWVDGGGDAWPDEIDELVRDGFASFVGAASPEAALAALGDFRALCPLRSGPHGVEAINRRLDPRRSSGVPGRIVEPVLIDRNDYSVDLFNGDMGVRFGADEGASAGRVHFPGADGAMRTLSELRLPSHEPCWAMSVHKSQGSEFDTVLVALPERSSPLLTREMLYTAITRARQRVVVWGSRDVLAECIERRVERRSGLRDALWPDSGE